MEYMKQLFATLLTLALGSFIFVGVLEDYKSDDSIKVKQLEDYFKPSRTLANSCLKQQNKLFLHYPQNGTSLRLLFDAMHNLMENPELERNHNYQLVLKGLLHNLQSTQKTQSELPDAVQKCREQVFLSLEALSIATGTFEYFSEQATKRDQRLNDLDKKYREKLKQSNGDFDSEELVSMMYQIGSLRPGSEQDIQELLVEFRQKLPMIERNSLIQAEIEQEKYKIEAEFFSEIRNKSAIEINAGFKQGFFSWLID
ncbi:hypothetical protein [Vibrio owensii]|uniref:hypothetical protein n=1 Tax=Vibrio owensii TaxID=696485 RepID=UPI00148C648E|nr:hypothetical protein [Vibrio owensii]NOI73998.1 hypothetical protein [Vibrio owensii]